MIELKESEISIVKKHLTGVEKAALAYSVTSNDDLAAGADILNRIKEGEKAMTTRKEEITRPLMDGLASARDLFRPFEAGFTAAKKIIKDKMQTWMDAEARRIAEEQRRIEARVLKGTMRSDTAAKKFEATGVAPTTAQGTTGKIITRTVTKFRIVNADIIPRPYLCPDMEAIKAAVIDRKQEVLGVEVYNERQIVSR